MEIFTRLRLALLFFVMHCSAIHSGEIADNNITNATAAWQIPGAPFQLNPNAPPSANFDLSRWYLSLPVDTNRDEKSDSVSEKSLSSGFELKPLFYTAADGGMVFVAPNYGAKTSTNTKYTRTELREMLRQGNTRIPVKGVNKNNWVLDGARLSAKKKAGAVDGNLTASLKVNRVSISGHKSKVGRVIIGQIHATKDEPIRLYYRKLPKNERGSVYFAHEINGGDDQWVELVGSRSDNARDPVDGIALNEPFGYQIRVRKGILSVTLFRKGKPPVQKQLDIRKSGYHSSNQYMYFKAGVYNQNNSGDKNDFVQATFYYLNVSH